MRPGTGASDSEGLLVPSRLCSRFLADDEEATRSRFVCEPCHVAPLSKRKLSRLSELPQLMVRGKSAGEILFREGRYDYRVPIRTNFS